VDSLLLEVLATTSTVPAETQSLQRRRPSVRLLCFYTVVRLRLTTPDDAANLTRRARGDFPGQDKEAKKAAEEGYESVRATAQSYVRPCSVESRAIANFRQTNSAKAEAQKAEQKINEMSVEARKKYEEAKREAEREYNAGRQTVNAKVNEFDRKTLEATRETKSWLGSWFGGK
jgi:hypothetical protein